MNLKSALLSRANIIHNLPFQDGKNKAQRWSDLLETIRKPGTESLFPQAQSGAPAKRHQCLWLAYLRCFPAIRPCRLQGERKKGKLYPSYTQSPCKTWWGINVLGSSGIIFTIDAYLFCLFSPCIWIVLHSLPPQLQRQEKNVSIKW